MSPDFAIGTFSRVAKRDVMTSFIFLLCLQNEMVARGTKETFDLAESSLTEHMLFFHHVLNHGLSQWQWQWHGMHRLETCELL